MPTFSRERERESGVRHTYTWMSKADARLIVSFIKLTCQAHPYTGRELQRLSPAVSLGALWYYWAMVICTMMSPILHNEVRVVHQEMSRSGLVVERK